MGCSEVNIEPSNAGVRVLLVVVVYNRRLDEVRGWKEVCDALRTPTGGSLFSVAHVLVYDNSPCRQSTVQIGDGITYLHNPNNGGTSAAYAAAADIARTARCDWLLLLDQDTQFTDQLLSDGFNALVSAVTPPAAIVPRVLHDSTCISPSTMTKCGSVVAWRGSQTHLQHEWITAISSGTLVRVSAVNAALPFPQGLWLDFVDHWLFLTIARRQESVAVSSVELTHSLSILDEQEISERRLRSILTAEASFLESLPNCARVVYPARLLQRAFRAGWVRRRSGLVILTHLVRWLLNRG